MHPLGEIEIVGGNQGRNARRGDQFQKAAKNVLAGFGIEISGWLIG